MTMDTIITFQGEALVALLNALGAQDSNAHTLRVARDGDEIKFKINEWTWTPGWPSTDARQVGHSDNAASWTPHAMSEREYRYLIDIVRRGRPWVVTHDQPWFNSAISQARDLEEFGLLTVRETGLRRQGINWVISEYTIEATQYGRAVAAQLAESMNKKGTKTS